MKNIYYIDWRGRKRVNTQMLNILALVSVLAIIAVKLAPLFALWRSLPAFQRVLVAIVACLALGTIIGMTVAFYLGL